MLIASIGRPVSNDSIAEAVYADEAPDRARRRVQTYISTLRSVDRQVAERAGRLCREIGIRLPDALIAASAIEHKLSLYTRNRSDFEKVRGLRIREIG